MLTRSPTCSPSSPIQEEQGRVQDSHDGLPEPEWWLDCETDQPRPLVQLLTLLLHAPPGKSSSNDPTMTVFCGPNGLTIHNAPNPQFQSTLELPMGLYRAYRAHRVANDTHADAAQVPSFSLSSKALLECLQVLCLVESPEYLHFKYHGPSQLLRLEARLPGGGMASAAVLGKMPPTESAELSAAFGASEVVARLLCASNYLQDASELDLVPGACSISLQFALLPQPALTLSVVGHSSQCQVILPGPVEITGGGRDGGGDEEDQTICHQYPFEAWKRAVKAIELAKETCLSINANGILAIQHQILLTGQQEAAFCDSLLLPLVPPDNDDNDDNRTAPSTSTSTQHSITDASRSSRFSYPLHSQPFDPSTRPLDDGSTIASATAMPQGNEPNPDSDSDESSSTRTPTISHPPLTFGSSTMSASDVVVAAASSGSSNLPSQRRRLSHRRQRRHSMENSAVLPSSSTSPSHLEESLGTEFHEEMATKGTASRQQKRNRSRTFLSQDSSSSSASSASPSPPSPRPQSDYCSSPEVVYGDMS